MQSVIDQNVIVWCTTVSVFTTLWCIFEKIMQRFAKPALEPNLTLLSFIFPETSTFNNQIVYKPTTWNEVPSTYYLGFRDEKINKTNHKKNAGIQGQNECKPLLENETPHPHQALAGNLHGQQSWGLYHMGKALDELLLQSPHKNCWMGSAGTLGPWGLCPVCSPGLALTAAQKCSRLILPPLWTSWLSHQLLVKSILNTYLTFQHLFLPTLLTVL